MSGLPFVSATLTVGRSAIGPANVVDTGSSRTAVRAARLATIEVAPEPNDRVYSARGIGERTGFHETGP